MSKLPPKLIFATASLFLFFMFAGGAIIVLSLSSSPRDYPNGEVVEGLGRCGTTAWLQRGKSVRVERYRCVLTADNPNEIFAWYVRNGYTPLNGGLAQKDIRDGFIPIIKINRIYMIDQNDGTIMVRIYDDTTVRAP